MAMQTPLNLIKIALKKRSHLLTSETNSLRIFDGNGDGAPGIYLDSFDNRWLVSTTNSTLAPQWKSALGSFGYSLYWKHLHQHQKESPKYLSGPECSEPFVICENGLFFEISFQSGYSQGIFLDQRLNRAFIKECGDPRESKSPLRILNTFSYTGAFSVAAAKAGAITTTLDLSAPYLEWSKRNFRLNHLDPSEHYFCKGDTFHWLKRFAKQGRQFDGIILDPPTFSRNQQGQVFRVETDYGELAALAANCLSSTGWLLCCTNFKQLSSTQFNRFLKQGIDQHSDHRHKSFIPLTMPPEYSEAAYLKSTLIQ